MVVAGLLVAGCGGDPTADVVINEGTQFTADVHAASGQLLVDVQGVLWSLPPGGGAGKPLTDALDDVRRPRVSPDGQRIAFQTYSAGNWDLAVMNADGTNRRSITSGPADDREPEWSASGREIIFSSDRSGNYDLWELDLDTQRLTRLTSDPADDYSPARASDGLVFVSDRGSRPGLFRWQAGAVTSLTKSPAGGLQPPRVSPDGRYVAYVQARRRNPFPGVATNELVLREIKSGEQRVLSTDATDIFAAAPAWLDSQTLLFSGDGKLHRLNTFTAQSTVIPFELALPIQRSALSPQPPIAYAQANQSVLGIVDPVALPDGRVVFTALGDLWTVNHAGKLTQLTNDVFVERDVSVSPDGTTLAYISDRAGNMQIWLRDLETGDARPVTRNSPGPRYPSFSPDGSRLAFLQVGPIGTKDFSLRILDLGSGEIRRLRKSPKIWPGRISWSADGRHITVAELAATSPRFSYGRNHLVRVDVENDSAETIDLEGRAPDTGPVASPDGRQLALVFDGALWRLRLESDGQPAGEPELVLDELVESPAWTADGKKIWALTRNGLEHIDTDTGERETRPISLRWANKQPQSKTVLRAARVLNATGDGYVENVDVLLDGGRIAAIMPRASLPEGTAVIDAEGLTVIPGLIDHHVHFQPHQGEWVGRALLAYGVTSVVEPGGLPYESREHMESWATGRRLGPRLVFAGPQLDGSRRSFHFATHIASERRLRWELARADQLDYGLIKTYTRLAPNLQLLAVELAHQQGLPVTAHAAYRNLGAGGNRIEHLRGSSRLSYSPKQSGLLKSYADVRRLIAASGGTVTPTVVVAGGFVSQVARRAEIAESRQYVELYSPRARAGVASLSRLVERNLDLVREGLGNGYSMLSALHDAGTAVVAGTDSPIFPYGLALVVELMSYVEAGLSPTEALQTATVNAAHALGVGDQVGRIDTGMLADMVIVAGDPLADISALLNTRGVIRNGVYLPIDTLLEAPGSPTGSDPSLTQ